MIRVKITMKSGEEWIATTFQVHPTPELTIDFLNKAAKRKKTGNIYALATEEEYQAYRKKMREIPKPTTKESP